MEKHCLLLSRGDPTKGLISMRFPGPCPALCLNKQVPVLLICQPGSGLSSALRLPGAGQCGLSYPQPLAPARRRPSLQEADVPDTHTARGGQEASCEFGPFQACQRLRFQPEKREKMSPVLALPVGSNLTPFRAVSVLSPQESF